MEHDHDLYNLPATHLFSVNSESPLLNAGEIHKNVEVIEQDILFLKRIFTQRLSAGANETIAFEWPMQDPDSGPYASLCNGIPAGERTLLLFSLLPHYAPEVLRELVAPVQQGLIITDPCVGGYVKRTSQQFIPTLQTVLFTCAGTDKTQQQLAYRQVTLEGSLMKRQIVALNSFEFSEQIISDKELIPTLADEYVHYLLQGRQPRPDFGRNFPAKLLTTDKSWEQLVLNPVTKRSLDLLIDWVDHGVGFSEGAKGYFSNGFPVLFYGPPGTGKSLSAALIGKQSGLHVFRVDASRIVSKYIGETEKNLVLLFERMKLENEKRDKKPILFFDEADVLFSKRTEVRDAKDKWANMETSVLLPLIEEYGGLAIIATNLEYNLDPAMDRRFQLKIKFPALSYSERVQIWEKGIPPAYSYPSGNAVAQLARYKLSPASIINILKASCLQAHKRSERVIISKDLEYFINLEFAKTGLTPSWDKTGEEIRVKN